MEKITRKGSLCSVKGMSTQAISDICQEVDPEGKRFTLLFVMRRIRLL